MDNEVLVTSPKKEKPLPLPPLMRRVSFPRRDENGMWDVSDMRICQYEPAGCKRPTLGGLYCTCIDHHCVVAFSELKTKYIEIYKHTLF